MGGLILALVVLFALAILFISVISRCADYTVDYLLDDLPKKLLSSPRPINSHPPDIPLTNLAMEICPICLEELAGMDSRYCSACGVRYHTECIE